MREPGRLAVSLLPKPWGRTDLPALYGSGSERIGEIWFERPEPLRDILAKYLFTDEKLSVQVHPTAANSPTQRGKDECWLITEAGEDAVLALGFRQDVEREHIRRAALDGSIAELLDWHPVRRDDFFYVPSGTVHAIGPGLTLVEIQQNTDITHRLFDYGRQRELHLDDALQSIIPGPHPRSLRRSVEPGEESLLVDGPHFRVALAIGSPSPDLAAYFGNEVQILPLSGECRLAGATVPEGGSGWARKLTDINFDNCDRCLLVAR